MLCTDIIRIQLVHNIVLMLCLTWDATSYLWFLEQHCFCLGNRSGCLGVATSDTNKLWQMPKEVKREMKAKQRAGQECIETKQGHQGRELTLHVADMAEERVGHQCRLPQVVQ